MTNTIQEPKSFEAWLAEDFLVEMPIRPNCSNCGQEIDPEVCHCGTLKKDHNDWLMGHGFVPMGCSCFYDQTSIYTFE